MEYADLGSAATSPSELLAELPTGEQVLTTSAGSLDVMHFDLLEAGRPESSALLRGRVVSADGGSAMLATDNGERCPLVDAGRLLPGDEGWAAVLADLHERGVRLRLGDWSPGTRPVTVPLYDTSLARCRLRSALLPSLVAELGIAGLDPVDVVLVKEVLAELHRLRAPQLLTDDNAGPAASLVRTALLADPSLDAGQHWRELVALVDLVPATTPVEASPVAVLATEQRAVEHLARLGVEDAVARRTGSDGVVEVVARDVVALVETDAVAVHERTLQAVVGLASLERKTPVFFSAGGYTLQALEWADRASLACFGLAADGSVEPRSLAALDLQRVVGGTFDGRIDGGIDGGRHARPVRAGAAT